MYLGYSLHHIGFIDRKIWRWIKRRVARYVIPHRVSDDVGQCHHKIAHRKEDDGPFGIAESAHIQQESQYLVQRGRERNICH